MICDFLEEDKENVISIHCLDGKDRTGVIICSYLMYCGYADSADNAIVYYTQKRFAKDSGMKNVS